MIVDTHVHVWEIDPPRYPVGPTAPNWKSLPDEPGTADELLAEMDEQGVDRSADGGHGRLLGAGRPS